MLRILFAAVAVAALAGCGGEAESSDSGGFGVVTATPTAAGSAAPVLTASPGPTVSAPPMPSSTASTTASGEYITEAQYAADPTAFDSGAILFFWSDDCEQCVQTDAAIEATGVKPNYTIVKVDFDSSPAVQKYGVKAPGRFVQVDADGNKIYDWTGSYTSDEITNMAKN